MAAARPDIVFIGFGEAGQAFGGAIGAPCRGYDRKLDHQATAEAMRAAFAACGVEAAPGNAAAIAGAPLVISLVTADQALAAAEETARTIAAGALYCDLNSVAPGTKQAAARAIEAAGAHYVDIAVMAPVHPQRLAVPMLASGPQAEAGAAALGALGFRVRVVGTRIGAVSAIKMIRSVMVKGIEALSAECALAANAAGVEAEVIASLDASWPGADWGTRFDYNLDRMLVHGTRRAAEMEEVVKTLEALGTGAAMSRGTVVRQAAIGGMGGIAPEGLAAKLAYLSGTPAEAGVVSLPGEPPRAIPAFAGMTGVEAGMTGVEAGMAEAEAGMAGAGAGMKGEGAGVTGVNVGMTEVQP